MPALKYKLIYFDLRGLGETIRWLFSYGGVDFEDDRVQFEDWPQLKPNITFGQLPLLEIDGRRFNQSAAIARYLAKKFKLAGSNDLEDLEIDAVMDTIVEFRTRLIQFFYEKDEIAKAKKKQQAKEEILPFYLDKLEDIAKKNKGHMALGKLTWADFYFAAQMDTWISVGSANEDIFAEHPSLKQVVENVRSLPKVKEWIAKHPNTKSSSRK